MRIAYICADPGVPVFGCKGCSIHVQEVLYALSRSGARITLFISATGGDAPPGLDGIEVQKLPGLPGGNSMCLAVRTLNEVLQAALEHAGPFDLVYERYSLWSFAGMEYARSMGIPGLLEVNAPLIEEQIMYRDPVDRAGAERVAEQVFSSASALIAVSREIAAYLDRYRGAAGKVHVVPNGVDPARFPAYLEPSRPAKPGIFTVGFVGSLKPWHGMHTLVEAFTHLHRQYPDTRLLIVGDGPEREGLVKYLKACRLSGSSEFTGAVTPSEVPGLLASMDAAVAPYPNLAHFYFSPLKIYEYMAAGLPVVASRIGQLAELISDGVNGILVPPGDPVALASALGRLRREPDLRISLGHAARMTVLSQHTWDVAVKRILYLSDHRAAVRQHCIKEI